MLLEAARFVVICYVASYKRVGEDTPEGLFRSIKLGTCGLCHFQGSVRTRLAQKICLGHKLVASGKALLFDPWFPNHRMGTIIPCHGGWYALSPGPGPWGCSGNVDRMVLTCTLTLWGRKWPSHVHAGHCLSPCPLWLRSPQRGTCPCSPCPAPGPGPLPSLIRGFRELRDLGLGLLGPWASVLVIWLLPDL